jgi:hypothetical protein
MTTLMILGAGLGIGLWALAVWVAPPRPALAISLDRATAPPIQTVPDAPAALRMIRPVVTLLRTVGLPTKSTTRDLVVMEWSVHAYLTEKATLALAGLLAPSIGTTGLVLLGIDTGLRIPSVLALGCAAAGFLIPDHRARRQAASRRTDFRHALCAFLDLVVISLAGGAGVDSALNDSANIGNGWAFTKIQRALAAARLTRTTPWTMLRQLGRDLDIAELSELAASVSLAGTEGAKVRQSLHAKTTALRTRLLTDAEGTAASDTERMSVPVMALFLGFLAFIAYPAMSQVLNGL